MGTGIKNTAQELEPREGGQIGPQHGAGVAFENQGLPQPPLHKMQFVTGYGEFHTDRGFEFSQGQIQVRREPVAHFRIFDDAGGVAVYIEVVFLFDEVYMQAVPGPLPQVPDAHYPDPVHSEGKSRVVPGAGCHCLGPGDDL